MYVDYGNRHQVTLDQMRPLHEKFTSMPCFAIPCALFKVCVALLWIFHQSACGLSSVSSFYSVWSVFSLTKEHLKCRLMSESMLSRADTAERRAGDEAGDNVDDAAHQH